MKFLITGANGQLATEFRRALEREGQEYAALTRAQLDMSDAGAVREAVAQYKPDVALNCAAYNNVDAAEKDFDAAFAVNATAVRNLAAACAGNKTLIVHYSTDYVFDGTKDDFYTEEDAPNPISSYGRTKLAGEKLLSEETDNFLLLRTSWLFGRGKQNFLYKISEWARKNRTLKIVCDQVSIPTYTEDIVVGTMLAIKNSLRGMYHLTNSGYASRYEVAHYFIERMGLDNVLLPETSDYFKTPAKRPAFSAMSNAKLSRQLGINFPHWQDGVDRYIKAVREDS
ncbi:MAG: dTDP-4-dehydrorhamnose reductase [Nitrospirae bacterium]|nr:MAG: dTDP-4-dehydrorhamnose reductase [Nitrospirota bacterium]